MPEKDERPHRPGRGADTITTGEKVTTPPLKAGAIAPAYVDPFADERAALAEAILVREAWLNALGLVVPERMPIAVLRRVAAMDRAA